MLGVLMPPARRVGPALIVSLAAGYAALWFGAGPPGRPTASYLGQFLGAEAVLLLAIGLILISTLLWVEVVSEGIDRAAIWHRRVAVTGVVQPIPHILLSANPHKTSLGPLLGEIGAIGLFVLVWAVTVPAAPVPAGAKPGAPGRTHTHPRAGQNPGDRLPSCRSPPGQILARQARTTLGPSQCPGGQVH